MIQGSLNKLYRGSFKLANSVGHNVINFHLIKIKIAG